MTNPNTPVIVGVAQLLNRIESLDEAIEPVEMMLRAARLEAFWSIPPRLPVALIDLVETKTPEAIRAFVKKATQLAEEVGGRRVLANEAIVPMIVPDERASKSDHATRLLVVTWYPTAGAGQIALAKRKEWGSEFSTESIRTYTARPSGGIESLVERTLPSALGLLGRKPVPKIDDTQKLESLIDAALILGEQPDEARWTMLALPKYRAAHVHRAAGLARTRLLATQPIAGL